MENVTWSGVDRSSVIRRLFGQRVARARKLRGLSQAELGYLLERTRASIANIELGKQGIQLDQIFGLADALDADVTDLIPGRKDVYESVGSPDETFLLIARENLNRLLLGSK